MLDRLIFERAGIVQGARVAAYLHGWIVSAYELDEFPTVVQVADRFGKSTRQVKRWRAVIRRYFTEDEFRAVVEQAAISYNAKDPVRVEVDPESVAA